MADTHDMNHGMERHAEEGPGCCCGGGSDGAGREADAGCCGGREGSGASGSGCCREEGSKAGNASTGSGKNCGGDPCMPAPTFSTFVLSLASSALVNLGEVPDPSTGKQEINLVLAKHTIDIIHMLQEKIQKGLDAEESRLLEGVLYELRMKFVIKK